MSLPGGRPSRSAPSASTRRCACCLRRGGRAASAFYGQAHLDRLAAIGRLQRRGYSLAAIKDLLGAGDAGGLAAVLGVELGGAALDETPLRLTRAQLDSRVPGPSAATLERARAVASPA